MTLRLKNILRVLAALSCVALVVAGVDVLEDTDWRGFLLLGGALLLFVGAFTPGRIAKVSKAELVSNEEL
jgi:hypothetical protein